MMMSHGAAIRAGK
jgi:hypothetical protein